MDTPGCPIWSVTVGCADTLVAAAGEDEFVRLFDLDTGHLLSEKAAHRDWVRSVSFASGAALLASGSGDRTVLLWSTADRELAPVRRIDLAEARVRSVAITDNADLVIAATESATIHAFTADGPAGRAQPPAGVDWVRSVAFAENGTIVVGCEDGAVRLWRTRDHDQLTLLGSGANTIWSTQFAADGQLAVLGHGNGLIECWDAIAAEPRRRLEAAAGRVWSLAANRDHIAAACGDGQVRAWSLGDDSEPRTFNDDQQRTWSVAVVPEVQRLAASTGDGRVRVWDLASGELRWERDADAGRVRSIAFDDGGELLAACGGDGLVRVWHAPTGDPVTEFANPAGWARTVAVDPAGKCLAVGSGAGDIYVRDIAGAGFTAHLPGHTGRVLMLGFTPHPDRLVSAAADGTARIWSLSEQRQLAEVRIDASLQCAAFHPETGRLLAASAGGVADSPHCTVKESRHMTETGRTETLPDAPPILGDVPGSFAWDVLHQRHPTLVQQIRDAFPYPPDRDHALDRLGHESSTGLITPLDRRAPDCELWDGWGRDHFGRRWIEVPFLWAESYFYRTLLDVIGFFEPGPWAGIDPFEPFKNAELNDTVLDTELVALDRVLSLPADERATALMHASLWGNRADLGFRISASSEPSAEEAVDLVADDTSLLWSMLTDQPGEICVVADNAGPELLADLVLIDHLLSSGCAASVTLHVKPYPYYVSDATTADLIACLRRLRQAPEQIAEVGHRLWQALRTGRLIVRTHTFSCAPWSYHRMPADLAEQFSAAALTIMKGDLNYRRLVGDCHWPATTPFGSLTRYFPGPVAALRTLKSDVVTGLDQQTLATLDSTGEPWRTNGTHALIQVRP